MSRDAPQSTVTMTDVLALPDAQCRLVTWLMRQGETGLDAVAAFLDAEEPAARAMVADLARRGFVAEAGTGADLTVTSRVSQARRPRVPSGLWDVLDCSAARRDNR